MAVFRKTNENVAVALRTFNSLPFPLESAETTVEMWFVATVATLEDDSDDPSVEEPP